MKHLVLVLRTLAAWAVTLLIAATLSRASSERPAAELTFCAMLLVAALCSSAAAATATLNCFI